MTPLEIALLIGGALIFAISFIIPSGKSGADGDIRSIVEDEVKKKVASEMDSVKSHLDDVVDEAVDYAQEKTERSLERISNEKIMAVNEYSDTVLEEINKNHKEVMFLYDMLNDKHDTLVSTVGEAEKIESGISSQTAEAKKVLDDSLKILEESKKNCDEAKVSYDRAQEALDAARESAEYAESVYNSAQADYAQVQKNFEMLQAEKIQAEDVHAENFRAEETFDASDIQISLAGSSEDAGGINFDNEYAGNSETVNEENSEDEVSTEYAENTSNDAGTEFEESTEDAVSTEDSVSTEDAVSTEDSVSTEDAVSKEYEENTGSDADTEFEENTEGMVAPEYELNPEKQYESVTEENDNVQQTDNMLQTDSVSQKESRRESEVKVRTLKWAAFAKQQADEAFNESDKAVNAEIDYPTLPKPARSISSYSEKENDANPQAQLHNKVLSLHRLGESDVEIARSLNMGVGEVSLIIGLHGNDK